MPLLFLAASGMHHQDNYTRLGTLWLALVLDDAADANFFQSSVLFLDAVLIAPCMFSLLHV